MKLGKVSEGYLKHSSQFSLLIRTTEDLKLTLGHSPIRMSAVGLLLP